MNLGQIELFILNTRKLCKMGLLALALVYFYSCSSSPPGLIILCAGDSITAAEYPRYLQRSLRGDGIRVQALNYGRNGNTSGEYLDFLKAFWLQHMSLLHTFRLQSVLSCHSKIPYLLLRLHRHIALTFLDQDPGN